MPARILVVGAAGQFAGLVLPELGKRDAIIRALVRDPKQEGAARAHGAAEVAVADLRDRQALAAALDGVERLFYIAPAFSRDEAGMGQGVVDAAAKAGVRRFVFSSVIHPILGALVNHVAKGPVEEAVLASGMEYAFLHPAMFFQNYAPAWPAIMDKGVLAEPYSAGRRMSRVDYRDVAEVAALALTEDRLLYGTFELCAPGDLNRHEVAALMSQASGRTVEAASPGFDEWTRLAKIPHDDDLRSPLKAMFDWYDAHELRGNSLTLRAILQREPRTLLQYVQELARQRPS